MSIKFRGGERLQRGKGIGGILRVLGGIFKPLMKSIGSTFVRAAKSSTGKAVGQALKEQALTSATHLTAEALRGNDLKQSLIDEVVSARENTADLIDNTNAIRKVTKRKAPTLTSKSKQKNSKSSIRGYTAYVNKVGKRDPF